MRSLHRNLLTFIVLLLPAQVFGEGFTILSNVDTTFQGGLGTVVSFASRLSGHTLRNVATTTYLQQHQLRTENELTGTIYDLDAERVITFDHKQKTYSSMTFAEMSATMERARKSAEESQAKASKAAPDTAVKKDQLNVKYHVTVDREAGYNRDMIPGYNAEHMYITITLDAEATEGGKTEQIGSMVLLVDQWTTNAAPLAPAYAEFYRLYAKKLGREFRSQMQGLQAAFASDPRMKDGFEAVAKELQKVQGVSLHTTTHVVLVPANMTFDRALTIPLGYDAKKTAVKAAEAQKSEKPKSGIRGFLGALKSAAADASKQLDKGNQNDGPPKQTTLLVIVDQMTSLSKGAVPAAMFAPPAGYSEVKPKSL